MPPDQERPTTGAMLPATKKADQLGVCTRTLDRWVESGILSQPVRINGRKYWPDNTTPKTA
jgi:predicted site-specific integrase-resolvase